MLSFSSDTILLKQIQNGYFDAVGVLVSKYERLLRTIIRNEVGNPEVVDDVYSETCLAIVRRFRNKGTVDIGTVSKWLKQVARSKCQEHWRNEEKRQELMEFAQKQHAAILDQELYRALHQNEVFEVIDEMSSIYKDVVELWVKGWTSAEIGGKLSIPESTVKSRKRAIIRKVREHFGVSLSQE
ncbi:MAG: sigma-70 family RNA polymerase sigma factor [Candidatus Poribacteria bacterium]|nr:sigma-70 family RNA polymerase sigma factor [Candidatus Poribacteria bacterium]